MSSPYAINFFKALAANSPDGSNAVTNWEYAGGDTGRHFNYFKIKFPPGTGFPPYATECICEHPIKENCFIQCKLNRDMLLVVGNCCIDTYFDTADKGRKCEDCGARHRNRIDNKCNECRKTECTRCKLRFKGKGTLCHVCRFQCRKCSAVIDKHERYCDEHKPKVVSPIRLHPCLECKGTFMDHWQEQYCYHCRVFSHCVNCHTRVAAGYWCAEHQPRCYECDRVVEARVDKCDTCRQSTWTLRFGKHKGKTFSWIKKNDTSYCAWVRHEKPDCGKKFREWLEVPEPEVNFW